MLRIARPVRLAQRQAPAGDETVRAASPGETVENWLIRNGQTSRLRELLWEPIALAALNQTPRHAAAPAFARVLAELFGSHEQDASIGIPTQPARSAVRHHRRGSSSRPSVAKFERALRPGRGCAAVRQPVLTYAVSSCAAVW